MNGLLREVSFVFPHFLLNFVCVKSFDSMLQEPALLGPILTIYAISSLPKVGMG